MNVRPTPNPKLAPSNRRPDGAVGRCEAVRERSFRSESERVPGGGHEAWTSAHSERMYSMDDLLYLLHSDGADALRLHVGQPPVIVLEGKPQPLEGPAITTEEAAQLLQNITNTRQRRELREHGSVEFIYRFRDRTSFVVRVQLEDENVTIEIH